jgi:hypothetical protein
VENRAVRLNLLSLALFALAPLTSGCGRTRARECSEVVQRINEGVKRNEDFEAERRTQRLDSTRQTAGQMETLSGIYREIYDRCSALSPGLTDKLLRADLDAYAHQAQLAADGTHLLATGIGSNRPEQARMGDETYARAVEEQKRLIDKINAYCAR